MTIDLLSFKKWLRTKYQKKTFSGEFLKGNKSNKKILLISPPSGSLITLDNNFNTSQTPVTLSNEVEINVDS